MILLSGAGQVTPEQMEEVTHAHSNTNLKLKSTVFPQLTEEQLYVCAIIIVGNPFHKTSKISLCQK